jgi:hypothetical protein
MKSLLSWTKEKITYRAAPSTRASSQRDNAIKSLEEVDPAIYLGQGLPCSQKLQDFKRVSSLLDGLVRALKVFAESHSGD